MRARLGDAIDGAAATLQPAAPTIISVLHLCLTDQNRTDAIVRAAIGLLGDLADTFPDGALRGQLASDWVDQALRVARSKTGASASSAETRKLVKWATVRALSLSPLTSAGGRQEGDSIAHPLRFHSQFLPRRCDGLKPPAYRVVQCIASALAFRVCQRLVQLQPRRALDLVRARLERRDACPLPAP